LLEIKILPKGELEILNVVGSMFFRPAKEVRLRLPETARPPAEVKPDSPAIEVNKSLLITNKVPPTEFKPDSPAREVKARFVLISRSPPTDVKPERPFRFVMDGPLMIMEPAICVQPA
jgi:hypothetical protein